ncbi:MAG: hypothetical protein VYA69_04565 [Gemmatimonadota bacterium]|nr:hypothetical protein [Gemmatimonadota bacterium]
MPGALLDHIRFSRRGNCAGSLICASDRMFLVHTEKDTIDLVEPEGLSEAGSLIETIVRKIDRKLYETPVYVVRLSRYQNG